MSEQVVRIVFIGGYARTGSTLLDRLLGQLDGFASFGELRHVWERCFLGDQLCGCGRPFHTCPFWREVADDAFGGFSSVDAAALGRLARSVDTFWNIPRIATAGWPAGYRGRLATYRDAVASLYIALQRVSGARVLVDSTKDPQHAYLLRSIPGFDVRVVHLVRDPRAVAFSWTRARRRPEIHWREQDMPRFSVARSAAAWVLANLAAEGLRAGRSGYVLARYEDLMAAPASALRAMIEGLGLGPVDLSFVAGRRATLRSAHTMAGNPVRFGSGEIELRVDDEWRTAMRGRDRGLVTAVAAPLMPRYGYGLRTDEGRARGGGPGLAEMGRICRLATRHRDDPMPYARSVADLALRYLRSRGVRPSGRWLDVGTGNGVFPLALEDAGARRAVGLDTSDRRIEGARTARFVIGRAQALPFRDASFDGVVSSNVLEHTGDVRASIRELLRVCRPGGTVYLSWTNWFSPLGGHEWSPFHYLGAGLGPKAYRLVRGAPPPWNLPGRTLFPVHVGPVLAELRGLDADVMDVAPRYWPALRSLSKVPLLREVAMWNCVILLRPRAARATADHRSVRRSAPVATHPEISWSIVLDAGLARSENPDDVTARLEEAWPKDGRVGAVPVVREARIEHHAERLEDLANRPYEDGEPLCRVVVFPGEPGRVTIAGHHAVLDGLGLVAVLGCAIGVPLGTTARGADVPRAAGARAGYAYGRILEAVLRPPHPIAPETGTSDPGDHLARTTVEGTFGSVELVAASATAVRAWNAARGARAERVVVAVGASNRPGATPVIGRHAAWFRVRVPNGGADEVRTAIRRRGPEPSGSTATLRAAASFGVPRALQRRTGSTLLVSHLGGIRPAEDLADVAFFPAAHGRSGVAVGAAAVDGRTTVSVRARRDDFSRPASAALLDLIVGALSPDGAPVGG